MANLNFPEVKDRDPNAEVDMEVLNNTIEYICHCNFKKWN